MKYDILIAGVGGQGTVLASRLLATAALEAGFFTRTSETIGMAQRGGCVVSHVRVGDEASPIIPPSHADLLIAFEPGEAARNIDSLSPNGICIVNTRAVMPVTASLGNSAYNVASVNEYIKKKFPGTVFVDAYSLAENAGSVKTVNVVLLGVAAAVGNMPMSRDIVERVIAENVPERFRNLNNKAFNLGFNAINK